MDITVYIAVALALLSAIAILLVVRSRKVFEQKTTTLTTLIDTWAEQKQQEKKSHRPTHRKSQMSYSRE